MAHKESIQSPDIRQWMNGADALWTVSDRVGYGYTNNSEDVRLVQFLLNAIFGSVNKYLGPSFELKNIPKALVPDGKFGGKTWAAIKWFQDMNSNTVIDGMVSPSNGTKLHTPKQGRVYTMIMLNHYYRELFPLYYRDIRGDPTIRPELAVHLTKLQ